MGEQPRIVVVGSCNIDQIAYAPRLPLPGESVHGHKYAVSFGGKGANQCVAAAKLGASTVMIAKVGDDSNGQGFIRNMKELGVDVSHMTTTKDACTGVAPITVADDGSNNLVVVSGANMLLSVADIERASNVIKKSNMLLCQLEIDMKTTLYALKIAKEAGVLTIFNPAPAVTNLSREFFKYCDIICPNETEASLLTGIQVKDVETAKTAVKKLIDYGCATCILTLGKDGCVFANSDTKEPCHIRGRTVTPLDTTGAGDAFIGSLAYFLCTFESMEFSQVLQRACWVAAESVCSEGTQKSYPEKRNLPLDLFDLDTRISTLN